MGRVDGKIAIVTGGASGLGAATARLLAREGARVIVSDIDLNGGEAVIRAITAEGGSSIFVQHDVTSDKDWQHVIATAQSEFGGLHILVNNAGIGVPGGNPETLSFEDWRKMIDVNLDSVFLGTRAAIPAICKMGVGGSIVNLSSIHALTGSPHTAAYGAAKGGVRSYTKAAALYCARAGYRIRVNSVHPGYIWTPMLEGAMRLRGDVEKERQAAGAVTPLGHIGEPADIAYGILYLASDESKYVTGTELVIDGGYTAQ